MNLFQLDQLAKKIKSMGFNCIEVSKITNFKEIFDGRAKRYILIFMAQYCIYRIIRNIQKNLKS